MQIDTHHQDDGSMVVEIIADCDAELSLTDSEWMRVANNQNKLNWNGNGSASLSKSVLQHGGLPAKEVYVKREGNHISVVWPAV